MVKLSIAIIGVPGSAFAVTIDENDYVFQLQDLIKDSNDIAGKANAYELALYVAKNKNGVWMTREEAARVGDYMDLPDLREPQRRLSRVGLSNADVNCDGEDDRVHVLVMMPSEHLPLHLIAQQYTETLAPFWAIAERLQDSHEVQSLSNQLTRIVAEGNESFVLLYNSIGTGKTQMAFNLQASGAWEVFYIVCSIPGESDDSAVFYAHAYRTNTFETCVSTDVDSMKKIDSAGLAELGSTHQFRTHSTLLLYGFILAALRGHGAFTGVARRQEVEKKLELRRQRGAKPMVFFLDEFPRPVHSIVPLVGTDFPDWQCTMRNVFLSFGFPVVVVFTGEPSQTSDDQSQAVVPSTPSCVVMPSLPRMVAIDGFDAAPKLVMDIISHSRPLFAKMAIDYVKTHPCHGGEATIAAYLDAMVSTLAPPVSWMIDDRTADCVEGQVGLLLHCTRDSPVPAEYEVDVINGHFARLLETTAFELTLTDDGAFCKDDEPWAPRSVLPSPEEDLLLHLMLTGGPWLRPFRERLFLVLPPILESLISAAIVVASHTGGFGGVLFPLFLRELLMELGLIHPDEADESAKLELPEKIADWASVVVPFLSPANAPWPAWLQDSSTRFDSLTQRDSGGDVSRVQFRTASNAICVDCVRDKNAPLNPRGMESILLAMPVDYSTHVVVVHSLRNQYFTVRKSWATFVAEHSKLQHVVFIAWARARDCERWLVCTTTGAQRRSWCCSLRASRMGAKATVLTSKSFDQGFFLQLGTCYLWMLGYGNYHIYCGVNTDSQIEASGVSRECGGRGDIGARALSRCR